MIFDVGAYPPFTSDNFPTASSDYDEQVAVLYTTPDINRRGPSPIMLFPAFKTGYHLFGSDYNLADKSEGVFPSTVSPLCLVSFCLTLCSYYHLTHSCEHLL